KYRDQNTQRKYKTKEDEGAVAKCQAHADLRECPGVSQSRGLLPVSSRKTSSSEGAAISKLESSFPFASRYLTSDTMVCGTRVECITYTPSEAWQSATPSSCFRATSDSGRARRSSMRVVPAERCLSSRGVPWAMTRP